MDKELKLREYAKKQNAVYDPNTEQILYGINRHMHGLGVNDGTLINLVNPLLLENQYKCGVGAAGGDVEYFDNYINYDMTGVIDIALIILIFVLIYHLFMTDRSNTTS